MTRLRLATRGSRLALAQSELVAGALRASHPGIEIELVRVRTEGDIDRSSPLTEIGGRGVFVRAVEQALLDRRAELAVHSLKDVPTAALEELTLAAILPRGDARDVLVASGGRRLAELPAGARVGSGSRRRALLLRALRPDIEVAPIRGNVDTRLGKVESGEYDAVVLAAAGLARLGRLGEATQLFEPMEFLPSPGQGALAVQCRSDDAATRELLAGSDDAPTRAAVEAERGVLAELGSGCSVPVGAYAQFADGLLALRAMIGTDEDGSGDGGGDGGGVSFGDAAGPADEAEALGRGLAEQLGAAGVAGAGPR